VLSEEQEQERRTRETKEKTDLFIRGLDVDEMIAQILINEGFRTIEEIAFVDIKELESIDSFNAELANELQKRAKDYLAKQEQNYFEQGHAMGMSDDLLNFSFVQRPVLLKLGENGIKNLNDLADLASDELVEILGEDNMSLRLAGRIIMKARELAYGIKEDAE
jgi:N utilization substance protein A